MVVCWFGSLIFFTEQKNPVVFTGFFQGQHQQGTLSCGSMVEWNLPEVIVNCNITLCLLLLNIRTHHPLNTINFPTGSPPGMNLCQPLPGCFVPCSRRMLAAKIIFHCIEELIAIGSAEVWQNLGVAGGWVVNNMRFPTWKYRFWEGFRFDFFEVFFWTVFF